MRSTRKHAKERYLKFLQELTKHPEGFQAAEMTRANNVSNAIPSILNRLRLIQRVKQGVYVWTGGEPNASHVAEMQLMIAATNLQNKREREKQKARQAVEEATYRDYKRIQIPAGTYNEKDLIEFLEKKVEELNIEERKAEEEKPDPVKPQAVQVKLFDLETAYKPQTDPMKLTDSEKESLAFKLLKSIPGKEYTISAKQTIIL